MSKQYFKADIQYNNNMGSSDKETLYILEDNTSDYMSVCTEDVKTLQDEGWTFDEELSVNGHMAFYKEEEIKGKFID